MSTDHKAVENELHPDTVALVNRIMRRHAALSVRVGLVFIVILIAIPLLNLYVPRIVTSDVAGFPVPWLILGVLFFPLTWVLSAYFVKASEELDAQIIKDEEHIS